MTDRRYDVQRSNHQKRNEKREHSSVGSERLPYKQRVGGSTPSAPTTRKGKSKQNPEVYRLRDFLFIAWTENILRGEARRLAVSALLEIVHGYKPLIFKKFRRNDNSRCDISRHTCSSENLLHPPVGHIRYRRCA